MKGIDIMELLGDMDDDMILHARQHRKHTPVWLRWASVAAILFCAVILTAVMLTRLLGGSQGTNPDPNQPDILAPGIEESQVESVNEDAESSREPDMVTPSPIPAATPASTDGAASTVSEPQESAYESVPAEISGPTADPAVESETEPAAEPDTSDSGNPLLDEASISVAGVTFGMNDTDVIALLGEPDSSEYYNDTVSGKSKELVYFGTISYFFSECETCGEYHLDTISELSGGNRMYPYGVTLDDSMYDVLDILGAEDFDTSTSQQIYALDDSHYAIFEVLYDNPQLHFISVYVGDIAWKMAFGQRDQLYINNISIMPERGIHNVHTRLANPS